MPAVTSIPQTEVEHLTELHTNRDLPAVRRRVALLRAAGWTLSGIGTPMKVPFSTVRAWQMAAYEADSSLRDFTLADLPEDVPVPTRPPRRRGHTIRVRKMRPDVPAAERDDLLRLSSEARILRRSTPRSHPAWASQTELEIRLNRYRRRGVSA